MQKLLLFLLVTSCLLSFSCWDSSKKESSGSSDGSGVSRVGDEPSLTQEPIKSDQVQNQAVTPGSKNIGSSSDDIVNCPKRLSGHGKTPAEAALSMACVDAEIGNMSLDFHKPSAPDNCSRECSVIVVADQPQCSNCPRQIQKTYHVAKSNSGDGWEADSNFGVWVETKASIEQKQKRTTILVNSMFNDAKITFASTIVKMDHLGTFDVDMSVSGLSSFDFDSGATTTPQLEVTGVMPNGEEVIFSGFYFIGGFGSFRLGSRELDDSDRISLLKKLNIDVDDENLTLTVKLTKVRLALRFDYYGAGSFEIKSDWKALQ